MIYLIMSSAMKEDENGNKKRTDGFELLKRLK